MAHRTCAAALLAAAAGAATTPRAAANVTVRELLHITDPQTWYGNTGIGLRSPSQPVLELASWMYDPKYLRGCEPPAAPGANATCWTSNVTADFTYQGVYVTSPGVVPRTPGGVDSLALWAQKPRGPTGPCYLVGFNSASPPQMDDPAPGQWKTLVSNNCSNLNILSFTRWMDLDDAGSIAVAHVQHGDIGSPTFGVYAYDGQTGAPRWNVTLAPAQAPPSGDIFYSFGVSVSGDGRWVLVDAGLYARTPHTFYVFSAADGSLRGNVTATHEGQSVLSHDGALLYACNNNSAPTATIYQWADAPGGGGAGAYQPLATIESPAPAGAQPGVTWYLASGAFGTDPSTGRTVVALAWLTSDGTGHQSFSAWDTARLGDGPIAAYTYTGDGSKYIIGSSEVACRGGVCAAALWNQLVNEHTPTVVVLDAGAPAGTRAGPAWTFDSYGSMMGVAVALGTNDKGAPVAFVAASGCHSHTACDVIGADGYLWQLEGLAGLPAA